MVIIKNITPGIELEKKIGYTEQTMNTKTLKELQNAVIWYWKLKDEGNTYYRLPAIIEKLEKRIEELKRRQKILN